jgi:hypothetical protein
MNDPMYYITKAADEGLVILAGLLLFDNHYSKEVLEGRARLYAVFDNLDTQTRSTSRFELFNNSERIMLNWTDEHWAVPSDFPPIPIPLTFVQQTSDPLVSELTYSYIQEEQQLNRIELLSQVALNEINQMNQIKTSLKVQKRIADLVIKDAIQQQLSCPITMNPFTPETATCVAPCYHLFDKEAITTWLETNDTCPECRERCSL